MPFPNPQTYEFPEWLLSGDYYYYAKDIVSFDTELSVENLKAAYMIGVFPWHIDGLPLPWFCPEKRAILEFSELHIPKSLEKIRRRSEFTVTIDKAFRRVIENCSRVTRSGEKGTWITDEFIETYIDLHTTGIAHSVEVWDENGEMAGGLYGVDAGGVFCGESMFHTAANASKIALLHLIEHLKERGATFLDIQVMTPHLKAIGAKEITRKQFLLKLQETQNLDLRLF